MLRLGLPGAVPRRRRGDAAQSVLRSTFFQRCLLEAPPKPGISAFTGDCEPALGFPRGRGFALGSASSVRLALEMQAMTLPNLHSEAFGDM